MTRFDKRACSLDQKTCLSNACKLSVARTGKLKLDRAFEQLDQYIIHAIRIMKTFIIKPLNQGFIMTNRFVATVSPCSPTIEYKNVPLGRKVKFSLCV